MAFSGEDRPLAGRLSGAHYAGNYSVSSVPIPKSHHCASLTQRLGQTIQMDGLTAGAGPANFRKNREMLREAS
jgi:hypothetical protein